MNILQTKRGLMAFAAVLAITSQSYAMEAPDETHLPPRAPGLRPLPKTPVDYGLGTLKDLPRDMLKLCMSELTLLEKVPLFLVSKEMNSVCKEDEKFYQEKLLTLFRKPIESWPRTTERVDLSALQVLVSTEAKKTPGGDYEHLTPVGLRTFLIRTNWKPTDPCFKRFHPESYIDCPWGELGYKILMRGAGNYPREAQSGYNASLEIFKGCEIFTNLSPKAQDFREAARAHYTRLEELADEGKTEEATTESRMDTSYSFEIIPYTKDLECQYNPSK